MAKPRKSQDIQNGAIEGRGEKINHQSNTKQMD